MYIELQDLRTKSKQSNASENPAIDLPANRATLYGDGFFTTGRIIAGRIDALEQHRFRIGQSLKRLKFMTPTTQVISDALEKACKGFEKAGFRLSMNRCQSARGYAISQQSTVQAILQVFDLIKPASKACQLILAKTPVSVNPYLAGIKHLNRLDNVLAASEINQPNQEALMFSDDVLIAGSRSNIFVKIDSKWCTPKLDKAGIEGICKQRLVDLLATQGIVVQSIIITRQALAKAQAALVTNSLIGVWPAQQLEGRPLDLVSSEQIQSWFFERYQGYL